MSDHDEAPHGQEEAVTPVVDAGAVFVTLGAACQGHITPPHLAQQLEKLHAFRGLGRDNALAAWSRHILDALPKLFQHSAGETIGDQLSEKLAQHNLLLSLLGDAGVFSKLHASVLRCLFEDGQRLQALMDVRELESKQQEQRARGGYGGEGGRFPLHEVILAAGRATAAAVPGGSGRAPDDVFYACVTRSVEELYNQVALVAAAAGRQPGQVAVDFESVAQLSKAIQVALGGALAEHARQQQWFGPAVNAAVAGLDRPEWIASADMCAALQALAEACCRLHPLLAQEAPQQIHENVLLLSELTDRLLNAFAAAITAAPIGQQRLHLHRDYAAMRERLLGQLLEHALALSQPDEAEHQIRRVQGLAEAHSSYPQLFDVADITNGWEQLHNEMLQLRGDGLSPPLASYVFDRLLREGRLAELLDLPPAFDADLERFLNDDAVDNAPLRRQLRWLHELRMGDYSGAANTLAQNVESDQGSCDACTLQRTLALQKLAALAACTLWPLAATADTQARAAQVDTAMEQLEAAAA